MADTTPSTAAPKQKVHKTEAEWRELLTPEQFHVMRQKGTERPLPGPSSTTTTTASTTAEPATPALHLRQEVRVGQRLAQLLAARLGRRHRSPRGLDPRHAPRRSHLRHLRRPPRPRLPRRPPPHRHALLHQQRLARLRKEIIIRSGHSLGCPTTCPEPAEGSRF